MSRDRCKKPGSKRIRAFAAVLCAGSVFSLAASAQVAAAPATSATAPPGGKTMAFDVVSIRENKDAQAMNHGQPEFGPTPNGYHIKGLPIGIVLLSAFAPSQGGGFFNPQQIQNLPDWMMRDRYDIDARVSADDVAAWQTPAKQTEMLHAMLEQMLAERFKLQVHRDLKEVAVYELTVGKSGLKAGVKPSAGEDLDKLKETNPRAQNLPGGAIVIPGSKPGEFVFHNATMASLGTMIQNMAGRPIQDKTGLPGRYDVTLQIAGEGGPQSELGAMLFTEIDEQLGLKLQPAKGQVETLVIDHVEKPTDN